MSTQSAFATFELTPADNQRLADLCGQFNAHLKQIEEHFGVKITQRGNLFCVDGHNDEVEQAEQVIRKLYDYTAEPGELGSDRVHLAISQMPQESGSLEPDIVIRTRKTRIRAQNDNQRRYIRRVFTHDINFGVGPAGTGKTYLAVACAAHALAESEVERILLVRPAVEAGERLGFLPGDIGQKIDPYLRPLYDALYEMLGFERVAKLIDRGVIELAPLAYMRGRTLNESFVILDEAQNTTIQQMKMFLTRIGFNSKAVITGDPSQLDLPNATPSGLRHSINILKNVDGISITRFESKDVVRHPLVQRIVEAYENEAEEKERQREYFKNNANKQNGSAADATPEQA